jgi:hypothetical protein
MIDLSTGKKPILPRNQARLENQNENEKLKIKI